jgi:hypothetical protein
MKTKILVCFTLLFLVSGCGEEAENLRSENENLKLNITQLEEELSSLKTALVSLKTELASQPKMLDKELAKKLLDIYLTVNPSIKSLDFLPNGVERAKADRLFDDGLSLTPKGFEIFGDLTDKNGKSSLYWYNFRNGEITFVDPISERVDSIDGIGEGRSSGTKVVNFTTSYTVPANTQKEVLKFISSGRSGEITFRLYDDGWRIVK